MGEYFRAAAAESVDSILTFYHDDFFRVTTHAEWREALDSVWTVLGRPRRASLVDWSVAVPIDGGLMSV